jgi:hypothetical protein
MSNATLPLFRPRIAPGQTIDNAANIASKTTLRTRQLILEATVRLHDELPASALSSVIAERLKVPKATVEAVVVGWLLQYRSEASALRCGIANAAQLASDAARESWGMR